MRYLYILHLSKTNTLYTGITDDIKRRLNEHKNGRVHSTYGKDPIKLIHCEGYLLKSDANRREKFLKTTEGKRLLRQQIKDVLSKIGYMPSSFNG